MNDAGTICQLNITTLNPFFVFSFYTSQYANAKYVPCLLCKSQSFTHHLRPRWLEVVETFTWSRGQFSDLVLNLNHLFWGGPIGSPKDHKRICWAYCISEVPWSLQGKTSQKPTLLNQICSERQKRLQVAFARFQYFCIICPIQVVNCPILHWAVFFPKDLAKGVS